MKRTKQQSYLFEADGSEEVLFRAFTGDGEVLKHVADVLKKCITGTAYFTINENGIFLIGGSMDKSSNQSGAIVDLELRSQDFESFYCESQIDIGLSPSALYKAFMPVKKKAAVSLCIPTDGSSLNIEVIQEQRRNNNLQQKSHISIEQHTLSRSSNFQTNFDKGHNLSKVDFQAICKKTGETQSICVKIQGTAFISIKGSVDATYGFEFGRGESNEKRMFYERSFSSGIFKCINKLGTITPSFVTLKPQIDGDGYLMIECKVGHIGSIRIYIKPDS